MIAARWPRPRTLHLNLDDVSERLNVPAAGARDLAGYRNARAKSVEGQRLGGEDSLVQQKKPRRQSVRQGGFGCRGELLEELQPPELLVGGYRVSRIFRIRE